MKPKTIITACGNYIVHGDPSRFLDFIGLNSEMAFVLPGRWERLASEVDYREFRTEVLRSGSVLAAARRIRRRLDGKEW